LKLQTLYILVFTFLIGLATAQAQNTGTAKSAELEKVNLKIYPNPSHDVFSLMNDKEVKHITLFNIVGKELEQFSHKPGKQHQIIKYPKGIYIVRLYNENKEVLKVLRLRKK